MARHSHRSRSSVMRWMRSVEGMRMILWIVLFHNFLRALPAALDDPRIGTLAPITVLVLLLAVLLLPPDHTDDHTDG